MSVKLKRETKDPLIETNPMTQDTSFGQRETTYEGYTFHWGENETRNFLDDAVGLGHLQHAAGNATGSRNIIFDAKPSGSARS